MFTVLVSGSPNLRRFCELCIEFAFRASIMKPVRRAGSSATLEKSPLAERNGERVRSGRFVKRRPKRTYAHACGSHWPNCYRAGLWFAACAGLHAVIAAIVFIALHVDVDSGGSRLNHKSCSYFSNTLQPFINLGNPARIPGTIAWSKKIHSGPD